MKNPFEQADHPDQMAVSEEGLRALHSTAKWGRFLAIIGYIGLGFMVLGGLGMSLFGTAWESVTRGPLGSEQTWEGSPIVLGLIYMGMAGLYFFPIYYLSAFSSRMIHATSNRNSIDMNSAFGMLRAHYRFMGILMIVLLSLYFFIFLLGMLALTV